MKRLIIAQFIFLGLLSSAVLAELAPLSEEDYQEQMAQIVSLSDRRDVTGLLEILRNSHIFVAAEAALRLGRLGAVEALPDLKKMDEQYAGFACRESGEFGVAVILIENPDSGSQKQALLKAAAHIPSLSGYTYSVVDQAGRELSRYEGDEIVAELRTQNTYGAQFTVLSLECKKLTTEAAIAKCIATLKAHETPMKAAAAEELLIKYGAAAKPEVANLKKRAEAKAGSLGDMFPIWRTIAGRCEYILDQIR